MGTAAVRGGRERCLAREGSEGPDARASVTAPFAAARRGPEARAPAPGPRRYTPRVHAEPPPVADRSPAASRAAGLPWLALPALLAVKQVAAARLAWDLGVGRRDLAGQALFTFGAGLALLALVRLARGWRPLLWFLAADALLSFLLFMDVLHIRVLGTPVSVSMLRYAGQLVSVRDAVGALLEPRQLLLVADLPLLALAWAWLRRRPPPARLPFRRAAVAVGLAVAATWAAAARWPPNPFLGHTGLAWRLGLVDFHALDLAEAARRLGPRPAASAAERAEVVARADGLGAGIPPGRLHGAAPRANVIIVQVESLQAFARGLTVGGQPVTPALDALAAESVVATSFFHQTGPGRTSDADLLCHCSVLPSPDRAVAFAYADDHFRCLPGLLAEAGYRTLAFTGTLADFWNARHMYQLYGFDSLDSLDVLARDEVILFGLSDASLLRQTLERLRATPEPFLAFVVTLTSHTDFPHGEPLPPASLPEPLLRRYLEAIHYVDRQLGAFVAGLRASGLLDRSVLAIYGDHDGLPGTSGLARVLGRPDDEVTRFELQREVPLLLRLPRGHHAGPEAEPLGEIDLAPTLAGIVGVGADGRAWLGRELGSARPAVLAFPGGAAVDAGRLYLPSHQAGGGGRCLDRAARAPLPVERCQDLAERGRRDVEVSRLLLDRDLQAGAGPVAEGRGSTAK